MKFFRRSAIGAGFSRAMKNKADALRVKSEGGKIEGPRSWGTRRNAVRWASPSSTLIRLRAYAPQAATMETSAKPRDPLGFTARTAYEVLRRFCLAFSAGIWRVVLRGR